MQFYSYIYKISFQFPLFTDSVLSLLSNMHTNDHIVGERKSAYSWAPINQRPYVTTPDTLSSYKIWKDLIESQSPAENQKNLGGKKPIPVLSLNICVTWDASLTSLSLNCLWKMKELEQRRLESPSRF